MSDESTPSPATIQRRRRAADHEWGPLARTYLAAMEIWDAEKADGVPLEVRHAHLEQTIRAAWPRGRAEPWHHACDRCSDTGWVPSVCTPETPCGRPFRLPGASGNDWTGRGRCSSGHSYVRPCHCQNGDEARRALNPKAVASDDYAAGAGKAKPKPRGFSRLGRA